MSLILPHKNIKDFKGLITRLKYKQCRVKWSTKVKNKVTCITKGHCPIDRTPRRNLRDKCLKACELNRE